jgi:hypothetical protein
MGVLDLIVFKRNSAFQPDLLSRLCPFCEAGASACLTKWTSQRYFSMSKHDSDVEKYQAPKPFNL